MKTLKTLLIRISIRIPLEIHLICCNKTIIFFPCCTGYERFSGHRVVTSLVSIKNCYSSRISSFFMSCFVFLFSLLSLYLFFFFCFLLCICYRCGWFAHIHGTLSCMWVLIQRLVSHPGATVNFVKWYFFYPICFSSNISRILTHCYCSMFWTFHNRQRLICLLLSILRVR